VTLYCVIAGVFFESRSFYNVMRRSFQILQFILFLFLLLLGDPYSAASFSKRWIFFAFSRALG
jgi:preprotein translocase subunit SecG